MGPDPWRWHQEVDEMLKSRKYNFANDFLESIIEQIEDEEFITERQVIAIENIQESTK